MADTPEPQTLIELTADIVAAYVANNQLDGAALAAIIGSVHQSLAKLSAGAVEPPAEPQVPAVPIKKSIMPDFIVCLEDGKKFKSLKRHLRTAYDMTPEQYRAKWNLPSDYPMVAPNYAASRSALAKSMGLGQQRRRRPPEPVSRSPRKKANA
ncbi:MucR family transcriptional regulator [Chelatococcus reniformis]|uniref:MucR family transcriptional regulator n=1 Tax=Chelatococcus reniformis TaxID=1494448 RepID=A0A916U7M3_9HYPH|nr:MucR family transcriptional regulator [Chelatococcus reniformis]GGC63319.1 MucR family transcriptional regulator [Chelatococcus reniformis]